MSTKHARYAAKAILAAAIAGTGAIATAATDGTVTVAEWAAIASSTLTAAGVVFGVPNGHRPAKLRGGRNARQQ